MAEVDNTKDLIAFKALSFDVYGTLINWEAGLLQALEPITVTLPPDQAYAKNPKLAHLRFHDICNELEAEQLTGRYRLHLTTTIKKLISELGLTDALDVDSIAEAVSTGPGSWNAFPDTIAGLKILKKHYKLIILSNIDNANIQRTLKGALGEVSFDAVYTAEDIGSYKPAPRNFRYLFEHAWSDLGVDVEKGDLLHVACSLRADHVAAKALGFKSAWISRGGDSEENQGVGGDYRRLMREGKVSFQWKVDTIGKFAEEVARQFGDK